jgi:hypothetical protein
MRFGPARSDWRGARRNPNQHPLPRVQRMLAFLTNVCVLVTRGGC